MRRKSGSGKPASPLYFAAARRKNKSHVVEFGTPNPLPLLVFLENRGLLSDALPFERAVFDNVSQCEPRHYAAHPEFHDQPQEGEREGHLPLRSEPGKTRDKSGEQFFRDAPLVLRRKQLSAFRDSSRPTRPDPECGRQGRPGQRQPHV